VIPALWLTVKPALGDHSFIKLKVVAQNRWLLNEGLLTGTGTVTTVSLWLLSICHPVSSRTAECIQNNRLINFNSSNSFIHSDNLLRSEAGVWLQAFNNFCHSFLSSAVLLSVKYFPFITSLSRCILFLPRVASPSFFPQSYHAVMTHILAHLLTTRLRFLTVSNNRPIPS